MDQLQPKTGNCLEIYFLFLSIVLILCLLNISNEYYRETGVYTLSEKHNIFVSEWSKYGLNGESSGNLISMVSLYLNNMMHS